MGGVGLMAYTYWLPDENNNPVEYSAENNSLILIGANGAGKSRLGIWLEKNKAEVTYRIGAQRSLNFGKYIQQKSFEQSTNLLLYGSDTPSSTNHDNRYQWDGREYNYVTSLMNDYENVLSALLAKKTIELENYYKECKTRGYSNLEHNKTPEIITEKLIRIWHGVFPHRNIRIEDGQVVVEFPNSENVAIYDGRNMSDGERVALYLIAQALVVPEKKILIIDEPELHLHRSIMNALWESIEKEREDCLFLYITHDTQFASSHRNAKKVWVKNYNGTSWEFDDVQSDVLPEQLMLQLLGNRKPVLFVEGEADSFDTKAYQEIYKDYYVVACGGCSTVIAWTKAMNNNPQLHNVKCFGIIDRDYRSEYEITKYRENNIFVCDVAEVENLFITEEMIAAVCETLALSFDDVMQQICKYVIEKRFKNQINSQICQAVVAEIKYKLGTVDISKKNEEKAKESLKSAVDSIDYDSIKGPIENNFDTIATNGNYADVIRIFNEKNIAGSIGQFFGMDNKTYCDFIVRKIQSGADNYVNAIMKYLPSVDDIPR